LSKFNITIIGAGYVGMSLSVLLSFHNNVKVFDIDENRVLKINNKESTVSDNLIDEYLKKDTLNIYATSDKTEALHDADFVVISTPTDYKEQSNSFDVSSVDASIKDILEINDKALIVIKSTVPEGYTKDANSRFDTSRVIFSPEFLREGNALYDNLYPSRIIVGSSSKKALIFAELLKKASAKEDCEILVMKSSEAEAVKLFSNSYLAMRVAFFNELDSYAMKKDFDTGLLINGVCLDSRIGEGYNNPSFGYGGYCLPKDTKQLLANFNASNTPQSLISSIIKSNEVRKEYLVDYIKDKEIGVLGIYRVNMKKGSDNFRSSAIEDIIKKVSMYVNEIIIYEPSYSHELLYNYKIENNLDKFKSDSDLIIANRLSANIDDVKDKLFSRDVFGEN
jgi:UDPglucose 6-dehydrogenase